jgi:hypothetical protein
MALVYRVVGDNGVYIGSTKRTIEQRMYMHLRDKNCMVRVLINPKIELIEECLEANRWVREQYWMDRTDCVNKNRAPTGLTESEYKKQYHQDNKEARNRTSHQYRLDNKEALAQIAKTKYICECGGRYTQRNKSTHLKTKTHLKYSNPQAAVKS